MSYVRPEKKRLACLVTFVLGLCVKSFVQADDKYHTVQVDGATRHYFVHVPGTAMNMPLVINLHGRGLYARAAEMVSA